MKLKHRHFPYPVLSPFTDDVTGNFEVDFDLKVTESEMQFSAQFKLENATLQQLITERKVIFAIHIECSSTMQRFLKKSSEVNFTFNINQKLLSNVVEVNFFIIANDDIKAYSNSDFHEDYEGLAFSLQKGDQLAFTETIKINITKEPIVQTSSIFEIALNPIKDAPLIATDFQEKIIISVPKVTYDEINNLRGFIGEDVDQIFIAIYYLPALIEALYYIRDLIEQDQLYEVESTAWYRSIANRLKGLGKDLEQLDIDDNIPDLAMKILDNINERVLISIARIFGIEEGDAADV